LHPSAIGGKKALFYLTPSGPFGPKGDYIVLLCNTSTSSLRLTPPGRKPKATVETPPGYYIQLCWTHYVLCLYPVGDRSASQHTVKGVRRVTHYGGCTLYQHPFNGVSIIGCTPTLFFLLFYNYSKTSLSLLGV